MKQLRNNAVLCKGKYRLEKILGQGGFGITYKAIMKETVSGSLGNMEGDIPVAIKEFFVKGVCQRDGDSTTISVSNAENTNSFEQQREKFKKEARRLRSLSNPHIVKVYDLFEENGTAYYVMDYVDGENLSARLKRTNAPLAEPAVRNYLNQILDGLEAIHNKGMFHLDIKPANIMVDSHDVVKLIDFGASKQQSTVGGATMSTGISYTNGYAPKEQMAQSYDKFGPWTDFYALGATMYKLLTNQDPPSISDLSEDGTEDKHLALPMPNISEEMKKLVVWMMQENRLKRPKNVGEIRKSAEQSVSNIASEGEESTIAINKKKNQCNDETGNGRKRDARRIYYDKKAWERLYSESEKRFLKKCRFFTIPLFVLWGVISSIEPLDKGDSSKSVGVSVFLYLFGLYIGYFLPYCINWFTLNYFVFHDVERKIKKNPSLLEINKTEKEYLQTSQKWIRLIVKCMYVVWPMTILVLVGLILRYQAVSFLADSGLYLLLIWSFIIAFILGLFIAILVKIVTYISTQAKETFK